MFGNPHFSCEPILTEPPQLGKPADFDRHAAVRARDWLFFDQLEQFLHKFLDRAWGARGQERRGNA